MQKWTIGKRLGVGFSVLVTITMAMGALAYVRLLDINQTSTSITGDALPGVQLIGKLDSNVREQRSFILRHIETDDAARKKEYERQITDYATRISEGLKEYEKTITEDEDRRLFDVLTSKRGAYSDARDNVVLPLSRAMKTAEAEAAYDGQAEPAYQEYVKAIEAEVNFNVTNGQRLGGAITSAISFTKLAILSAIALALALSVGIGLVIVRSINTALGTAVSQLGEGAEQVVSAASQVSTSSQSLSQGATEQAASLEETSASMEEMASMTRKNAENSQQAAALMGEVDKRVRESDGALRDMVTSMSEIQESSQKVSKIIKTIDEIAFQTNILALNAAVEAARAGEAGMGFAVVADEVRSLAQRSAQAAKDTAALIEESMGKTETGVSKVEQVSGAIAGITESVVQVKGLVDEVSIASRQQSQGIDQVSQAVAQMEKVTQTTAATAEESAAASEELNAQAEQTMHVVDALRVLVGSAAVGKPAAVPQARAAARPAATVTRMPTPVKTHAIPLTADEEPLQPTGTFGSF